MSKTNGDKTHILGSIVISLISSAIFSFVVDPLIRKINALKSLEINFSFPVSSDSPISFNLSLITILLLLSTMCLLCVYISVVVTKKRTSEAIKSNLPNDNFCKTCETTSSLTNKCETEQKRYEQLLSEYQKALPYKKLTDQLNEFFDQNEVLESLQLFSIPDLPTLEQANRLEHIDIPLRFISGMAKNTSNTNALFNINYTLETPLYHDIKRLFDMRNQYYARNSSQRDAKTEDDIQREAIRIYYSIKQELDSISNINCIKETHYVCYKLLDILANVVVGDEEILECGQLLNSQTIEEQLKFGQRTGMLGAVFTDQLYFFYNENSMTKKDRIYFSVRISYKKHQLILLGICNKNNLRIAKNHDYIKCCTQIYDDIRKTLAKLGGEAA